MGQTIHALPVTHTPAWDGIQYRHQHQRQQQNHQQYRQCQHPHRKHAAMAVSTTGAMAARMAGAGLPTRGGGGGIQRDASASGSGCASASASGCSSTCMPLQAMHAARATGGRGVGCQAASGGGIAVAAHGRQRGGPPCVRARTSMHLKLGAQHVAAAAAPQLQNRGFAAAAAAGSGEGSADGEGSSGSGAAAAASGGIQVEERWRKTYHVTASARRNSCTARTDDGYEVHSDIPRYMGGGGAAPQPVQLLLSALAGCEAATANYVAGRMRLRLRRIEFSLSAWRDQRGALGLPIEDDPPQPSMLRAVCGTARVDTDASQAQLDVLAHQVHKRCPIASMMAASGCEVDVRWVKAEAGAEAGQ